MKFMKKTSRKNNYTIIVEKPEHKTAPVTMNPDGQAGWAIALDTLFNWVAFLPNAPEKPVK
jgi:hypothetical protein